MKKPDWGFTVPEAAKALGVTRQYLYALVNANKLNPRSVAVHEFRFTEEDMVSHRETKCSITPPPGAAVAP
jgi:excisionase family DNA binding protein